MEREKLLVSKIHRFPLRYSKSFVHCSGRSWVIMRDTHSFAGCSLVPDDLFQDKIPESQPKGGIWLEWQKRKETFLQEGLDAVAFVCLVFASEQQSFRRKSSFFRTLLIGYRYVHVFVSFKSRTCNILYITINNRSEF